MEDLISIGTIGLIKAINTFAPEKNIKLATYASRCIENEILMYLRRNSKTRMEVSIDEPLNVDWDGNELLLSDILGTDEDVIYQDMETEVEHKLAELRPSRQLSKRRTDHCGAAFWHQHPGRRGEDPERSGRFLEFPSPIFPGWKKDYEAAPERDGPFFLILFTHMGSGPADVGGEIRIFIIKDILIITIDDHGVLIMVDSLGLFDRSSYGHGRG